MNSLRLTVALLLSLFISEIALAQGTRLLRHPTVSRDSIAFEYAGDLWIVGRGGGQARRLTSTAGAEIDPYFSPDGSQIAFTSTVAGNTDVYVVPSAGGNPKDLPTIRVWIAHADGRLTVSASSLLQAGPAHHNRRTFVFGPSAWMADCPTRCQCPARSAEFTHRTAGASPTTRSPRRSSPPGTRPSMWRHYRGGRTHPVQVMNLNDNSVEKLPWNNSNDTLPMWIGNTIYFLSDRNYTDQRLCLSYRHEAGISADPSRRL